MRHLWALLLTIPVLGQDVDRENPSETIDRIVAESLRLDGLRPAPRSDDAEFFRRIHIDLVGRLPKREEVREFLDDPDRKFAVDRLLDDDGFNTFWSEVWLRTLIGYDIYTYFRQDLDVEGLRKWMQAQFKARRGWDEISRDLLTARGNFKEEPATNFLIYYVKPNTRSSVDVANAVSRAFLGYRLQCAQCHDHPFDDWTQDEFWSWTALFARTRQRTKNTFDGTRTVLAERRKGEQTYKGKTFAPRFLDGTEPSADQPRRDALAEWLVSSRQFARATVNRVWAHMTGRGLVDPVDSFGASSNPSHPGLLEALTDFFIESGADLRDLMRAIALSETYQRTSSQVKGETVSVDALTHHRIRPMHPVALFNALINIMNGEAFLETAEFKQAKLYLLYAIQSMLGQREGSDEVGYQGNIQQALVFMNGKDFYNGAISPISRLGEAMRSSRRVRKRIHELTLGLLGRPATEAEIRLHTAYVKKRGGRRDAYEDVAWVLMNSSEFFFNH